MSLVPRKKLRGPALDKAFLALLAEPEKWPRGTPLTWENLAVKLDVSRQALERKQSRVDAFHSAKEQFCAAATNTGRDPRRDEVDRLKEAHSKIAELERQLDAWRQKWIEMEKNCHAKNMNPSEVMGYLFRNR
jgi:hypothetical protein